MLHECIMRKKEDEMAWGEQYLVQCKCHMGSTWQTWQPGDPEFICPTEASHGTTNNMSPEDV